LFGWATARRLTRRERCVRPAPAGCRAVRGQHARAVVSFHLRTSPREGRMTVTIGRRELLAALGGAAAAWPLAARAQQRERMRRIGVLASNLAADDPEWQVRSNAFVQGLQERGWSDGRNVGIEYRWGLGDPDRLRKYAAELVALAPDVMLAA